MQRTIKKLPYNKLELAMQVNFYSYNDSIIYAESKNAKNSCFHPVTNEMINNALSSIRKNTNEKGIVTDKSSGEIPREVVYFDFHTQKELVWITKKMKRTIIIQCGDKSIDGIHSIIIPQTVFYVNNNSLSIFFVRINKRIDSILYPTPFMNINPSGDVCTGNQSKVISIKKANSLQTVINNWEDIFFRSPFTHMSSNKWIFNDKFPEKTYHLAWKYFIKKGEISLSFINKSNSIIKDLIK